MAFDAFLKIDGIEGESQDSTHAKEIHVHSYSWGMTQSATSGAGGGGGGGKVNMQDFHFVCDMGKHSPKIMEKCATGDHIKNCVLTLRKAGGDKQEYLKATFTDVIISSFQSGGSGGSNNDNPTEQVSFNFTKVEKEYKEQKADGTLGGTIKAGYDVKKNIKV